MSPVPPLFRADTHGPPRQFIVPNAIQSEVPGVVKLIVCPCVGATDEMVIRGEVAEAMVPVRITIRKAKEGGRFRLVDKVNSRYTWFLSTDLPPSLELGLSLWEAGNCPR